MSKSFLITIKKHWTFLNDHPVLCSECRHPSLLLWKHWQKAKAHNSKTASIEYRVLWDGTNVCKVVGSGCERWWEDSDRTFSCVRAPYFGSLDRPLPHLLNPHHLRGHQSLQERILQWTSYGWLDSRDAGLWDKMVSKCPKNQELLIWKQFIFQIQECHFPMIMGMYLYHNFVMIRKDLILREIHKLQRSHCP